MTHPTRVGGYTTGDIYSLVPGKSEWNFRYLIFQIISVSDGWVISCELTLRWMSLDLTHDKSTLVQVMTWCLQATSHYLSQCWPQSLSPYGVTRPQCVKQWTYIYIDQGSREYFGIKYCSCFKKYLRFLNLNLDSHFTVDLLTSAMGFFKM